MYEADHYFGYYNGYIYKLIDRVYNNHGPSGLRREIKYIIQYLNFLFNKTYRGFDVYISSPGGYMNSYYGLKKCLLPLIQAKKTNKKTAV